MAISHTHTHKQTHISTENLKLPPCNDHVHIWIWYQAIHVLPQLWKTSHIIIDFIHLTISFSFCVNLFNFARFYSLLSLFFFLLWFNRKLEPSIFAVIAVVGFVCFVVVGLFFLHWRQNKILMCFICGRQSYDIRNGLNWIEIGVLYTHRPNMCIENQSHFTLI